MCLKAQILRLFNQGDKLPFKFSQPHRQLRAVLGRQLFALWAPQLRHCIAHGPDFFAEGAKFSTDVDPKHGAPIVVDMGKDEFGHARLGGIAAILAREIERRTGFETRTVVLGHVQRGGSPSAFDRMLATRYGLGAIDMVHRGEFGCMAALRGNKIVSVPLADAIAKNRTVDQETIDVASGILDKLTSDKVAVEK